MEDTERADRAGAGWQIKSAKTESGERKMGMVGCKAGGERTKAHDTYDTETNAIVGTAEGVLLAAS